MLSNATHPSTLTVEEKFRLAQAILFNGAPFDMSVLQSMLVVEKEGIPTMQTDCVSVVHWSRAFVEKLTPDALATVLAHEAAHKWLMHHINRGPRDPVLWNIANDFVINAELNRRGFKFPDCLGPRVSIDQFINGQGDGFPFDPSVQVSESSEEIYERLRKRLESKGGGQPGGKPGGMPSPGTLEGMDQIIEPEAINPVDGKPVDASLQRIVGDLQQAKLAAKSIGQLPAMVERLLGKFDRPVEDWRKALSHYLSQAAFLKRTDDRSYARPSRRSPYPLLLPGQKREPRGEYVVAIDTSGSISEDDLANYQAQLNAIFKAVQPKRVVVIYCDARVNHVDDFDEKTSVTLKMHGGGGTDFRPPFDWVAKNKVRPTAFVYFTDMWGPAPDKPPRYPVIWALTTDQNPPWGKTVRIPT